jgi:aldose sugar dehydrogenase
MRDGWQVPEPVRRAAMAAAVTALLGLSACSAPAATPGDSGRSAAPTPPPPPPAAAPAQAGVPDLQVDVVASGLSDVWDIGFLPDGRMLVTQGANGLALVSSTTAGASVTPVAADLDDLYLRGEAGLMGMVVHPDFAQSRRFTTCQTHMQEGEPTDIRLVTWELSADGTAASRVADPLVGGLPINESGRHSGCRPRIADDGALLVGTGDSARGTVSQDLTSLGGKVLRVDLATGEPAPGNPFADAENPAQQLVYTYGHRNVQGVAVQPGTGEIYTAEHGPDIDDEVNRLQPGANYGWDPSQGGTVGGYDESVPMTDLERFPDAVPAVWSSGDPTEAICGAVFLSGRQWGALDGALAVGALRGEKLLLMTMGADGTITQVNVPEQLDGAFGRFRSVRLGPDGALFISTSNGEDDRVLRVDPV